MKQTFILLFLFSSFFVVSQEHNQYCGTDEMMVQLVEKRPELKQGIINAHNSLEAFTQSYINKPHTERSNPTYIIPVVFHVIHDNGSGNISKEQILDGLKQVNMQFRKLNPDTSDIIAPFKALAADTEIEFRLAKIDPNGNCTNGITRTYSPLTNAGGHAVKDIIHWPPNKYLNIYVCNFVGNSLAGHCLMPSTADTIPEWDGICIQHSYVGSIGTSNHNKRTVLTHEIGHYLNLQHIWGGNNVPGFFYLPVGDPGNCAFDDGVSDTPNTVGNSLCSLSASSCGSTVDMVQNYMDYSYCSLLFTEGQKLRMHAALNSSVANRNNLWTTANLNATGVLQAAQLCHAIPQISKKVSCAGESITFTDISYHKVTGRTWNLEGASTQVSTDSIVTVTYTTPGTYDVKLTATDGINTVDTLLKDYIIVLESNPTKTYLLENFEDTTSLSNQWIIPENSNPFRFHQTNTGKNSNHSIFLDNFNGPELATYTFYSKSFDASAINKIAISYDYAYANTDSTDLETLKVQFSTDCGTSWVTKRSTGLFNDYSTTQNTPFFPQDEDWIHKEFIFPIGTSYSIKNLMVRFIFKSQTGNNMFIDNIMISSSEELSTTDFDAANSYAVFPNPATQQLQFVSSDVPLDGTIEIINVLGEKIYTSEIHTKFAAKISVSSFSDGTYILRYIPKDSTTNAVIKKIVITH